MSKEYETKTRIESSTIRSAVRQFIISAIALYVLFSGDVIAMESIEKWANYAGLAGMIVYNFWETKNVIKGRVRADTVVQERPWKEEVKTLINLTKGK